MPRIGIAVKLLLVLGVLTLAPLVFTGWHLLGLNRQEIVSKTLELQTKLVSPLADKVGERFAESQKRLAFLRSALESRDVSFRQKQVILESYLAAHSELRLMALVEKENGEEFLRVIQADVPSETTRHSGFLWDSALTAPEGFVWNAARSEKTGGKLEFDFYLRLNPSLYLFMKEDASDIALLIEKERFGGTGFAYLMDANSILLTDYSGGATKEGAQAAGSALHTPLTVTAVQNISSIGSRHFEDPRDGRRYVGSWAPVSLGDRFLWVVAQQAEEDAYASHRAIRRRALFILFFSIGAALLVAVYSARFISRPVRTLARAACQIAKGNFDVRIEPSRSGDELTELGTAFKDMAEKLNEYSRMQLDRLLMEKTKTDAAVNSMAEGFLLLEENKIVLINDVAKGILDPMRNRTEFNGLTLEAAAEEARREKILEVWSRAKEKPGLAFDLDFSTSEDSKYILELKTQKVELKKDDGSVPVGTLVILRDVTLEKEIEKMKEDFVHMITHDLRSPLQTIGGYTEQMLAGALGQLDGVQKTAMQAIEKGTSRLLNMINNILDTFKMEHGAMKPKFALHDAGAIVLEAVELFKGKALAKGVELQQSLNGSPGTGDWKLECDRELVERVLSNLVNNALNYTPPKGTVTVYLSGDDSAVRFSVRDTGEGISKDDMDKLFKKFGQIHGKSKGGTGLGLLITKKIAEIHGGSIEVESRPGQGSSFTLCLPRRQGKIG